MEGYWIKINVDKLVREKDELIYTMKEIAEEFPFDPVSNKQVKRYFENYGFDLPDLRSISLEALAYRLDQTDDNFYLLTGLIEYYKIKYLLRNYVNHILKRQEDGLYHFREESGHLLMQNKRPLPYSDVILSCVISTNVPYIQSRLRVQQQLEKGDD